MLGMTFVQGNPEKAFEPAFPLVISEKMAEKIFADKDPVNKTLNLNGRTYEITGVFKNMPEHTRFQFEWLIPFRVYEKDLVDKNWVDKDNWRNNWMQCYVELSPSSDVKAVNARLKELIPTKTDGKSETELFVYPVLKLNLYGEFIDGKSTGSGYIRTVRTFFFIGLLILLIACINFMNLSTARSQNRVREVGVRKTFGERRSSMMLSFIGESGVITVIALALAAGIIVLCLPSFNSLVSRKLALDFLNPYHSLGFLTIGIICTFLAGSYPAFYLSSFSPMNSLKKITTGGGGGAALIRKGLVVFQFAAAFILICVTLVIFMQIRHVQKRNLGMNKDNLVLYDAGKLKANSDIVQHELLGTGFVEATGFSSQRLINIHNNGSGLTWNGKDPNTNPLISFVFITPGLIKAAGLKLADGQELEPGDAGMEHSVIINQTLADMMKEEGRVGGRIGWDANNLFEIKAIVADFVFNKMSGNTKEPVWFRYNVGLTNHLFVRLRQDANTVEALAGIKSTLEKFSPDENPEPVFMDDIFNRTFSEQKTEGQLALLFAALAIFISCLGLFGLSAFSAEQRTKEIGIRKVLGASVWDILVMLGRSYMILIGIATVIGLPVAFYVTDKYLADYAYHIPLGWTIFAGVAILVGVIAVLTVSVQSLRAATANPTKAIEN
jgi:ABC-type antimicrobial peptide transport system permease subunit